MSKIDLSNILDYLQNCLIIFDKEYNIIFSNNPAKIILKDYKNILAIINQEYLSILKNGVENKFAFIITEHFKHNKPILNISHESYKVIIRPFFDEFFIMEAIEINSIKVANTFFRSKIQEYENKLGLLDKLINLKRKTISSLNPESEDYIYRYEEQLKFELAIDAALSQIYEPMISQTTSFTNIAETILTQSKLITNSEYGYIFAQNISIYEDVSYLVSDSMSKHTINKNLEKLWKFALDSHKAFYINSLDNYDIPDDLSIDNIKNIKCFISIPIMFDKEYVGQIVLANSKKDYTENDLRAALRLSQFYSLAIQRKKFDDELKRLATFDTMTDSLNRRTGLEFLDKYFKLACRNQSKLTICYLDINNLKTVNDTYGHKEGDKLIRLVSSTFKKCLRESDIISRLGGDEFLIILPDASQEDARQILERICANLSTWSEIEKKPYKASISFGIVEYSQNIIKSPNHFLELADNEMYKNKQTYKDSNSQ